MTLAFLNIGGQEMIFILIVVLVLFGGKKLPEIARGLGRGIREFKDASEDIKREISDQINDFEKDLDVEVDIDPTSENASEESEMDDKQESVSTEEIDEGAGTEEDDENEEHTVPVFTPVEGTYKHNPGVDAGPQEGYQYGYADKDASKEDPESIEIEEAEVAEKKPKVSAEDNSSESLGFTEEDENSKETDNTSK